MKGVEQIYDGEWYDAKDYPFEACCDCGLVHRVKTRIRNGRVQLCATREVRRTAALRKEMGKMSQKRGMLTDRIKEKSKELLGYEIDAVELRLMPYVLYVMMNDQALDIRKINGKERDILAKWRSAGHITGGASSMGITKEFWNIICELCFLGYVDLGEDEDHEYSTRQK